MDFQVRRLASLGRATDLEVHRTAGCRFDGLGSPSYGGMQARRTWKSIVRWDAGSTDLEVHRTVGCRLDGLGRPSYREESILAGRLVRGLAGGCLLFFVRCHHVGGGMGSAGSHRDVQFLNSNLVRPDCGSSTDRHAGAFAEAHHDFDVGPAHALVATLHRLHRGLFGSPASGEMLIRVCRSEAVLDLIGGVDAFQKLFAVRFDHLCDANTLHNFCTDTKDRHRCVHLVDWKMVTQCFVMRASFENWISTFRKSGLPLSSLRLDSPKGE